MKNKYKKIIFSLAAILFILFPQISLAQGLKDAFGEKSPLEEVRGKAGYSVTDDIGTISGRVINTALTLVGIVFLLLMVYAGYLWMTAQGEDAKVDKAQTIIKGTVIGLVLVLSAYAITIFVTRGLNPVPAPPTVVSCKFITMPPENDPNCVNAKCTSSENKNDCQVACCKWE